MPHDPDNAHIYDTSDVYVSFNLEATDPASVDDEFGVDWELVGLLQEGSGFTTARDEDTGDHFSWNGGFIRRHYKNVHVTKAFTPIEDNDTVRRIINRGVYEDTELVLATGPPERCKLALVLTDTPKDYVKIEIWDEAEVVMSGDVVESEEDITAYEFTAHIFGTGVAGTRLEGTVSGS